MLIFNRELVYDGYNFYWFVRNNRKVLWNLLKDYFFTGSLFWNFTVPYPGILTFVIFFQLMEVSVCGQHGQLAVRRAGLVLSLEVEPAQIQFPPTRDKTVPGNMIRQRAVNWRHVPVTLFFSLFIYLTIRLWTHDLCRMSTHEITVLKENGRR